MNEELLIRCCAPTLASLKTGSLFTCKAESARALNESITQFNRKLVKKGLRILPLRYKDGVGLIYAYRPRKLCRDLTEERACRILCERGYPYENASLCIRQLILNLSLQEEFPHEIGLFLGYPPEDVEGFINDRSACKYCGRWKVYTDVHKAKKAFANYRKCTDLYLKHYASGTEIEKLTVAV